MSRAKPAAEARPEPAGFQGFPDPGRKFFRELAKQNDRAFFLANKDRYEREWVAPLTALLGEVRAKLDRSYPDVELAEPKIFRLHRDQRFSKDKTPYKTHIGGRIPVVRSGSAVEVPIALYFQTGDETFVGAGQWGVSAAALPRFRAALLDEKKGAELDKILRKALTPGFAITAMETLKSVPRGVDPAHPRAELLRHKGLALKLPLPDRAALGSPDLVGQLVAHARQAAPLVRWLAYATG